MSSRFKTCTKADKNKSYSENKFQWYKISGLYSDTAGVAFKNVFPC